MSDSPVVVEIALTTDELHALIDFLGADSDWPIRYPVHVASALATFRACLLLAEHHGAPTGPSGAAGGSSRDLYSHMSDREYQDCHDAGRVI